MLPQKQNRRLQMAKISKLLIERIEDAEIACNRPTKQDLNEYYRDQRDAKGDIAGTRIELFDRIFAYVNNLEDDDGLIPEDGKERIPDDVKDSFILKHIEYKRLDLKNS